MALTQNKRTASASAGAVSAPDKNIAGSSTSSSTLLYTVPAGRKAEVYIGHEYTYANSYDYYLDIDVGGTYIQVMGGLSRQSYTYRSLTTPLITLHAGTRILTRSSNSGNAYFLGVEKDA